MREKRETEIEKERGRQRRNGRRVREKDRQRDTETEKGMGEILTSVLTFMTPSSVMVDMCRMGVPLAPRS